jgi:MFS family permease
VRAGSLERSPLRSPSFRAPIAVSMLVMFGFGLIVPTLPLFARRFGVGEAGIGLVLTVFAATRLAADLVAGPLIDRFGERAMVALGAAVVGLSSIGAGSAPSFGALVALRGAGGVGSALFLGGLMAHLIDVVRPEERGRAMSIFQAVIGVGLLLGPLAGGVVAAVAGLRAPLYAYGVICLASAPLCLRAMRRRGSAGALALAPPLLEEQPPAPEAPAWRRLRPLLGDSAYRAALAGTAAGFFVSGGLQTLVPGFWVEALGRPRAGVGLPFTALAVASLAVTWHAGSLSDRRGRRATLVPALAGTGAAAAAIGFARDAMPLVGLMVLLGVASGYARPGPTSIVGDVAPPEARGVAVAGYRTAGDAGALLGPAVAGTVAQTLGYRAAFLAVGAAAGAAALAALVARETAPGRVAG